MHSEWSENDPEEDELQLSPLISLNTLKALRWVSNVLQLQVMESCRSILHASGLSHMTQPIGELWCALTSLQAYINHFGMTYVEAQAQSIEIPLRSCAPSTSPAPLWAIWHEPNVTILSAELSSSIAVLRELQLVDEHPLLDRSLLVILSVRGYLPPPIEEGI